MSHISPEGTGTTPSEGDPAAPTTPPFKLDGRDILTQVFMSAIQGCLHDGDRDISTEIFRILDEMTTDTFGPYKPGEWVCFNLKDFEVGRAYPYDGATFRIVRQRPTQEFLEKIHEVADAG